MRLLTAASAAIFMVAGSGCIFGPKEKPEFTYFPNMHYSPAVKAQEPGMRMPPEGTIPREMKPYAFAGNPEAAGRNLKNPLKMTRANLNRGQEMFGIYCKVCHGDVGRGDGKVIGPFPKPPSLLSGRVSGLPDGHLYHIITDGQNIMPGYATQISRQDRWTIVQYLRVLYRATHASAEDVRKAESM